jgi:hypothetical protein
VSGPVPKGDGTKTGPTADEKMSPKEKDALADQIEDFEGPDRREKRGTEPPEKHEPGVARS